MYYNRKEYVTWNGMEWNRNDSEIFSVFLFLAVHLIILSLTSHTKFLSFALLKFSIMLKAQ